eukprot:TRINITY_DN31965_c0_g1_i1.p1 TRINITY_DN31965_c0_g1~~TRINITY_DN31965_c0_g1_i1.p1  ORF type:complete len:290 (+),score=68.13 TRINITY_DN31965_c0_g1_i1:207-1076(+)
MGRMGRRGRMIRGGITPSRHLLSSIHMRRVPACRRTTLTAAAQQQAGRLCLRRGMRVTRGQGRTPRMGMPRRRSSVSPSHTTRSPSSVRGSRTTCTKARGNRSGTISSISSSSSIHRSSTTSSISSSSSIHRSSTTSSISSSSTQYQPQQVPSPRDAGGVKEEDHVPATSPMVSPRPVVVTCPFEKLAKVMAEVDSIRVRFERNSFTSLTHSDSLTDDSILKTRKSYDESLMRCMLQLDAIEAVGDDRDKIKAERRSVIANIQKLQSCLEDFVERERTLRELENTQSIS